jgi:hypothetical protein
MVTRRVHCRSVSHQRKTGNIARGTVGSYSRGIPPAPCSNGSRDDGADAAPANCYGDWDNVRLPECSKFASIP